MIALVATAGTPVRLRPLPLGELLDESFKLYRRHFTVIAGVAVAVILPNLILTLLSGSYRANPFNYIQQVIQNANDPVALQAIQDRQSQYTSSPLYLFSFLVSALILPFTVGALYRAATSLAAGNLETIGSALAGTARRYFAIWGIILLAALVFAGGIAIITIPIVIWVLVRWSVATPALFGEGIGPVRAVGRSWNLVRENWWLPIFHGNLQVAEPHYRQCSEPVALLRHCCWSPVGQRYTERTSFLSHAII